MELSNLCVIGNFDGVHRGHQQLLAAARAEAAARGLKLVALTFEPHPRQYFTPDCPPFRLTSAPLRQALLAPLVDRVITLPFDATLATLSAIDFIDKIIIGRLHARSVIVGADFRFGQGRSGDTVLLREKLGTEHVITPDLYTDEVGLPISSSRIRHFIAQKDINSAQNLLKRPYMVEIEAFSAKNIAKIADNAQLMPQNGTYTGCVGENSWQKIEFSIQNRLIIRRDGDFAATNRLLTFGDAMPPSLNLPPL